MPTKGYPRTRFEIVDKTNVQEISTNTITYPKPLAMQLITADKGPENWTVVRDLDDFANKYGSISFAKHGQAQLNVAEILRAGGAVLVKRLVGDNAGIGNETLCVKFSKTIDMHTPTEEDPAKSPTYNIDFIWTCMSKTNNPYNDTEKIFKTHDEVVKAINDKYTSSSHKSFVDVFTYEKKEGDVADNATDNTLTISTSYPLFTITTVDRETTNLSFKMSPIYNNENVLYKFSLYENINGKDELVSGANNIAVSLDPNLQINNIPYDIESRVNVNMSSIRVQMYPNNINEYVSIINRYFNPNNFTISAYNRDLIGLFNPDGASMYDITSSNIKVFSNEDTRNLYVNNGMSVNINCPDVDPVSFSRDDSSYERCVELALHALGTMKGTAGAPNSDADPDNYAEGYYTSIITNRTNFDTIIYDTDRYKIDFVCDAGYDIRIKNSIAYLAGYRQDFVFLCDLSNISKTNVANAEIYNINAKSEIIEAASKIAESKFVAIYHNTADVYDPYTKKQIKITLPYLLGPKMVNHINNGVGKPFAGILNNITFPEIIDGSVNFIPRVFHKIDQKADFVEKNINYITYYDSLPVMDTMYVNMPNYTQLSYLNNIMNVQTIIKELRTRCPKTRYTFMDGTDLQRYLDDTISIINNYNSFFKSISIKYMADAEYESQNIFYAVLTVQFRNFVQEEYFRIFAIS